MKNKYCADCQAECCSHYVPLENSLIEKFGHLIDRPILSKHQFLNEIKTVFETVDGKCVFLNSEYRCKIYEQRPWICREFGNPNTTSPFLKCSFMPGSMLQSNENFSLADMALRKRLFELEKVCR
jgi:Fe-S-cluster containining protein